MPPCDTAKSMVMYVQSFFEPVYNTISQVVDVVIGRNTDFLTPEARLLFDAKVHEIRSKDLGNCAVNNSGASRTLLHWLDLPSQLGNLRLHLLSCQV